ncbi:MAG: MBL fold metallo-hydrolase [Phycisphaerales bacterium]|nr:MAG: MBL fold metallo-hydrolase [Phycisphaerales bacterium]
MKYHLLCTLLSGLWTPSAHADPGEPAPAGPETHKSGTQIVLLGTGTPIAYPDRSGPAVAIVVNDTPYIVDCGPGVVRRAMAAYQAGVDALRITDLKHLFVTHLHSDHTVGYPDVILTPWVLGRDVPLEVFGPPGIQAMTDHILKAYEEDIDLRINGLEQGNPEGWKVNVHEIEPGIFYKNDEVTVRAFPVKHGSWEHAFGFRFEAKDRTVVISGDTARCQALIDNAKGCDVLIHEVYSEAALSKRKSKKKKYHPAFHTSGPELGRIANEVKPGLLILYHQLLWGATEEELLDEIRQVYKGRVVFGNDLDVF